MFYCIKQTKKKAADRGFKEENTEKDFASSVAANKLCAFIFFPPFKDHFPLNHLSQGLWVLDSRVGLGVRSVGLDPRLRAQGLHGIEQSKSPLSSPLEAGGIRNIIET